MVDIGILIYIHFVTECLYNCVDDKWDEYGKKQKLLDHMDQVHTTKRGIDRIKRNLKLDNMDVDGDVVKYCKKMILSEKCMIYKRGKNWYCEIDNMIITVNSYSYTIITVHVKK